jgi:hypothetical protein
MTVLQDVSPEQLATLFFHYREALAQDFGCRHVEGTGGNQSWETAPGNERKLLIAAARLVLLDLAAAARSKVKEKAGSGWRGGTEGKECGC